MSIISTDSASWIEAAPPGTSIVVCYVGDQAATSIIECLLFFAHRTLSVLYNLWEGIGHFYKPRINRLLLNRRYCRLCGGRRSCCTSLICCINIILHYGGQIVPNHIKPRDHARIEPGEGRPNSNCSKAGYRAEERLKRIRFRCRSG